MNNTNRKNIKNTSSKYGCSHGATHTHTISKIGNFGN